MQDASVWIILCIIIVFTALVGYFMGRGTANAQGRDRAGEGALWWPDKLQRLFWLLSPFILTIVAMPIGDHYQIETGNLWGLFFALVIIQAVVGGMFGFQFDLVGSVVCGVFIAVEYFLLGGFFVASVPGASGYFGWYFVIGILAIAAGAVLTIWIGSLPRRSLKRGK